MVTRSLILAFISSALLFSCGEETKVNSNSSASTYVPTFGKGIKTDIGTTGFTIDLPATHTMQEQKGPDFTVYYIGSVDTTINKGEAGIYFGPAPDEHGPESVVSKEESVGMHLGKNSKTVKYFTPKYTWIETVIDEGDGKKIQTWYYAYSETDLSNLGKMMETLARKN